MTDKINDKIDVLNKKSLQIDKINVLLDVDYQYGENLGER